MEEIRSRKLQPIYNALERYACVVTEAVDPATTAAEIVRP